MPSFDLESLHFKQSDEQDNALIVGIDEVGRGPLAGPVVAACVHIPNHLWTMDFIKDIKDSKKLSHKKLEQLYTNITEHFIWSISEVTPSDIDEINIHHATLKAMSKALSSINAYPTHALIDGKHAPKNIPCTTQTVVKGDHISYSIAAASIIAKVTRDRIMKKLHEKHPHYGWNSNVGYPTQAHKNAINQYGITKHHRKSYAPVKNFLLYGTTQTPNETAA